ncbi:Male-specific lethal 3 [Cichlidogyrus casuarinus]|uniref:Male-specific lethal 3 n=1 Tax=Cichlidogyrus casuarinus TaxID=1844966 RepID=A0ABD2QIL1_9PLAT
MIIDQFFKLICRCSNEFSDLLATFKDFKGWKRKWDREVPEDILLEDNKFNRMLKQKIDEVACKVADREKRRQRIDLILFGASMSGDDVDWDHLPGVWRPEDSLDTSSASKKSFFKNSIFPNNQYFNFRSSGEFDDKNPLDVERFQCENLDVHCTFMPKIVLPPVLYSIVEQHLINSLKDPKNTETYSVCQFLQAYLDSFPNRDLSLPSWGHYNNHIDLIRRSYTVHGLEKSARSFFQSYQQTDTSKVICAEFVSGLRIIFDNMFHDYLLTQNELKHLEKLPKVESDGTLQETSTPFKVLSQHDANEQPDLPCLNYGIRYLLRLFVRLPRIIHNMNLTKTRKAIVLRHLNLLIIYLDHTKTFWLRKYVPLSPSKSPPKVHVVDPDASSQNTEPQDVAEFDEAISVTSSNSTVPAESHQKKPTPNPPKSPVQTPKARNTRSRSASKEKVMKIATSTPTSHRERQKSPESTITKKKRTRNSLTKEILNLTTTLRGTTPAKRRRVTLR